MNIRFLFKIKIIWFIKPKRSLDIRDFHIMRDPVKVGRKAF